MRWLIVAFVLVAACSAAPLSQPCGDVGEPCCVADGATGDMAGSEYAFACAQGAWCEHGDAGAGGICRRSP